MEINRFACFEKTCNSLGVRQWCWPRQVTSPWPRSVVRFVAALIRALPEAEQVRSCSHTTEILKKASAPEHYFNCIRFYVTWERVRAASNPHPVSQMARPGCMAQLNLTSTAEAKINFNKPTLTTPNHQSKELLAQSLCRDWSSRLLLYP